MERPSTGPSSRSFYRCSRLASPVIGISPYPEPGPKLKKDKT